MHRVLFHFKLPFASEYLPHEYILSLPVTVQVISHVWVLVMQKLGFSQGKISRQAWGDVKKVKDLRFQRGKIDGS